MLRRTVAPVLVTGRLDAVVAGAGGMLVVVVVVVGASGGTTSTAPMSHATPCGRATAR